jgi:predicted Zn-dependent protease with MMP-like domain
VQFGMVQTGAATARPGLTVTERALRLENLPAGIWIGRRFDAGLRNGARNQHHHSDPSQHFAIKSNMKEAVLPPDHPTSAHLTPDHFDRLVEAAYARIPARFRSRMKNVAVMVEAEPSALQLTRSRVPNGSTLLGLYEGRPLTMRSVFDSFTMPDRITIFQGPHERLARDRAHLIKLVDDTVWHEVAHYFGLNERQVRAAERKRR